MQYITKSEEELIKLGYKIAKNFKAGDIVLLEGDLGAGKTTITKGIAKYFGIKKNITSPTFTLLNIYQPSKMSFLHRRKSITQLVHIDTYRLEDEKNLIEIGAEDYLGDEKTICLIEWPEKIKNLLKNKNTKTIKIKHLDNNRKIMID